MYEEALMEIWIHVAEIVIVGVFVELGLLKALRQKSKDTDFRMFVEVEAAKRKQKQQMPSSDDSSQVAQDKEEGQRSAGS